MKKIQTSKVLGHMLLIGPITQKEAIEKYGCYRLAARISDIEKFGIMVSRRSIKVPTADGNTRIMEYFLDEEQFASCIDRLATLKEATS